METKLKGFKIFRDVKTMWLSMVLLVKRVMSKYQTLIQKMQEDGNDATATHTSREVAKANFSLLLDVSISNALSCFFYCCLRLCTTSCNFPNNMISLCATSLGPLRCVKNNYTHCFFFLLLYIYIRCIQRDDGSLGVLTQHHVRGVGDIGVGYE